MASLPAATITVNLNPISTESKPDIDDVLQIDLLGPEEQNIEMNVLISNITDQTCRTKTTMTFRKDGFLMFIMRLFTGLDVELSNTIHYYRTKRTILS